jgi:serine/threonine protein kinase
MPYPASATRLLGQTIDGGALRIKSILGAGTFGVVYRAVDTRSGAHYAVKRVEKGCFDYRRSRESRYHARVSSHPNVLTFHREIDAGSHAFFVYDLCAGDLHSVINRLTFFRKDELIKSVFTQIIDALDFCHSRGIYHRDLKPENILVSSLSGDIEIFVADFGLATSSKMTASSCGTSCYMSPGMHLVCYGTSSPLLIIFAESLVPHHHPYSSVEGDIWALGCILAEMIANVCLWNSASPEDREYNDYLMDRSILLDVLPVSDDTYSLLKKIFSPRPECRPSLDEIRKEVLAMDTFFLTDREAAICGWTTRLEKMQLKMAKYAVPSRRPEDTPSESFSSYSSGSSSSAFESFSVESSATPLTPPTPAVEAFYSMDKVAVLALPVAAFHQTR